MQKIIIGRYEIEQINEDEFEITYTYSTGGYAKTIVCGGDFEIVLGTLLLFRELGENKYLAELKDILKAIVANTSDSTKRLAESGLDIVELLEKETV